MSDTNADGSGVPADATTMSEGVVARIADLAARAVPGVLAPGSAVVRLGRTDAAVDVALVAQHGTDLVDLAAQVRRAVAASVLRMTDLRVSEVNVTVVDVRAPGQ